MQIEEPDWLAENFVDENGDEYAIFWVPEKVWVKVTLLGRK